MSEAPSALPTGAYEGSAPVIGRVPAPVREVVKAGVRWFGTATARWRPGPDFIVIGSKRGGTTTLYDALVRHPGVTPLVPRIQRLKSPHYFDLHHDRGTAWYRSHFPIAGNDPAGRRQCGEAAPYLLYHPASPAWVAQEAPDARLIAMLRDPVERAFSHHWDRVKNGLEPLGFEAALDAESERLAGQEELLRRDPHTPRPAHEHWSYLDRGDYARQLRRWRDAGLADRLLVLRSEDFYADPAAVFGQICDFLGLVRWTPPQFGRHHAHADRPKVTPQLRARIWPRVAPAVADLGQVLGTPRWWDAEGPNRTISDQVVLMPACERAVGPTSAAA